MRHSEGGRQSEGGAAHRQLFLTPEARCFLECGYGAGVHELAGHIARALEGHTKKTGRIRLTSTGWLLYIMDPLEAGGPERVVVWQGPTDGLFFKKEILERAHCAGANLV